MSLPSVMRKLMVQQITNRFRDAVTVVKAPLPVPGPGQLLIRNRFVGVNATDINYTAGKYDPNVKVPFECGLEALGEVVGGNSTRLREAVAYIHPGAYSEYTVILEDDALSLPRADPKYLPLILSGLTASIALDKSGEIKKGETVLVTAAAGGTGQFAVQWAKLAGCHVIGTCSSPEKLQFLKSLGCDRAIDYTMEDLSTVLQQEYSAGVDVVFECIGGDTFDVCFQNLARFGRLIAIGSISEYEEGFDCKKYSPPMSVQLRKKSASLKGFLLPHYTHLLAEYLRKMVSLLDSGKLTSTIDMGETSTHGRFVGVEKIADAVEYLYTRKSKGKIIVDLTAEK